MWLHGKSVCSWCDGSMDRSFMVNPLRYFSFQPVFHDWCSKGHCICYPVCGMMHIKDPLLLIEKSSHCGGSGFLLSLSKFSCTLYVCCPITVKINVLRVSLNKRCPSFLVRGGPRCSSVVRVFAHGVLGRWINP